MAGKKARPGTAGRPTRPPRDDDGGGEDRSFGKVLRTKSIERIVPDAVNRFEAGRRLYAQGAVTVAKAELQVLLKERKRAREEGERERSTDARLERLIAAVECDLAYGQATLEAIERAVAPAPGGWTAVGRVLRRDGAVPRRVEVLFVSEDNNEPMDELGVLDLAPDGSVRATYPADVVNRAIEKGLRVAAAVRVGGRIVAADETPVRIRADGVYQFDLRVESALA